MTHNPSCASPRPRTDRRAERTATPDVPRAPLNTCAPCAPRKLTIALP